MPEHFLPGAIDSFQITSRSFITKVSTLFVLVDIPSFYYIGRFHIIHLQNPSKLTEKQMDKVGRIVHPKLRPFYFQIKT